MTTPTIQMLPVSRGPYRLHAELVPAPGHYVQVDQPHRVADLIMAA
jgi:hypothetical protein